MIFYQKNLLQFITKRIFRKIYEWVFERSDSFYQNDSVVVIFDQKRSKWSKMAKIVKNGQNGQK